MVRQVLRYSPSGAAADELIEPSELAPGPDRSTVITIDGVPEWVVENPQSRVWYVGDSAWMYPTIQAAIDAINADPVPPSQTAQCVVRIAPGTYEMTARIDLPNWVTIQGTCKTSVHLRNNTTDMFRCLGPGVVFEEFTIDGSTTNNTIYGIDCNNQVGIYVRNVDMFSVPSGQCKQRFLKQDGASWSVLHIDTCTIDYRALSDYAIFLRNTGAVRFCDTWIERCFIDAFALTSFGGCVYTEKVQDVRLWYNVMRGTGANYTGVFVSRGGTGTGIVVELAHHTGSGALGGGHAGGIAVFGESNCTVVLDNCLARGAAVAGGGTLTSRNSFITA